MAKEKTVFFCQACGYESGKWMGQCPACKEWNTFVEEKVKKEAAGKKTGKKRKESASLVRLADVSMEQEDRILTGIAELDRVLGGGIVEGSLMLIGGDPGIGKSTLLLQMCRNLVASGKSVIYISGEESLQQIKMRAVRIGGPTDALELFCETDIEDICDLLIERRPDVAVIDSIQTVYSPDITSAPGSVSQVREATAMLLAAAKQNAVSVFIVGHVTKEGAVAGPRVLEHMVDTVLYFEGDRHASYRILRAAKNRFGSTDEIGVFEMRSDGLREVADPSEYMISERPEDASGSIVSCSVEGTRPILVEIQALVARSSFGFPKRTATGADINRVNLLIAVIEKRARIDLSDCDAYVNIAGGIRMNEPAVDLGLVLALVSSSRDLPVDRHTAAFGEVGLSGEIRAVRNAEQRVAELEKLGFTKVILPFANRKDLQERQSIRIVSVRSLREAIDAIGG